MKTKEELEQALRAVLPVAYTAQASHVADILFQSLSGKEGDISIDPSVSSALKELAGQDIISPSSVISFGTGSQVGDVKISDVVGGDVFHFSINIEPQNKNQSTVSFGEKTQMGDFTAGDIASGDISKTTNYNYYGISDNEVHRKYRKAAEGYLKAKDFKSAYQYYTKSLRVFPTSESFLGRAKLLLALVYNSQFSSDRKSIEAAAFSDASSAVAFAEEFDLERQARLFRLNLSIEIMKEESLEDDIEWLTPHVSNHEKADVILAQVESISLNDVYFEESSNSEKAALMLEEIVKLGRSDVFVSCHYVNLHIGRRNYGLALKEIEKALNMPNAQKRIWFLLHARIWVFSRMGDLKKTFDAAKNARQKLGDINVYSFLTHHEVSENILYLCSLLLEFDKNLTDELKVAIKVILNQLFLLDRSMIDKHPDLIQTLRKIGSSKPTK